MSRIPIGGVRYLNAEPLVRYLDPEQFEVLRGHPAEVAAWLREGRVALGLVPVAAVLAEGDAYRVVPEHAIGADGAVRSVLLVAETPPESWTNVVLDGESRTSAVLATLLLAEGPLAERVRPGLVIDPIEPGTGVESARGTTASLVIGDAALALPERLTVRIDLAALWREWTGHPFVFAVWAGRPDVPDSVVRAVREAGREGLAARSRDHHGADLEYLTKAIRYELDDAALIGLRRFAALARRCDLLPSDEVCLFGPRAEKRPAPPDLDALLAKAGQLDAAEAARLLEKADTAALATAADAVAFAARSGEVQWTSEEPVSVGAADLVARLIALREAGAECVEVAMPTADGWRTGPGGGTAVEWLRRVAVARLVLGPAVDVAVRWDGQRADAVQSALGFGATRIVGVKLPDSAEQAGKMRREVERHIASAGGQPVSAASVG